MAKITLAQISPYLGDINKNLDLHIGLIEKGIESKADIIVFPELSLSGYFLRDLVVDAGLSLKSPILKKIKELSKYISIIIGGVLEDEDYLLYNSAFYFEDEELKYIHRKVYLPDYTMFEEGRYFTAGNRFTVFNTKHFRSGLLICEDALQVSSIYAMKLQKVEIIYVISNSPARGLYENKFYSKDFWYTALKYMALSCNAYVVFVNRVGVEEGVTFWGGSTIFSPMGEIITELPLFDNADVMVNIEKSELKRARVISPFLKDDKAQIILHTIKKMEI
ncbi:hydrolase, carbon-nitrogen family [Deferribacter desulfuricans SSM1]|uniref:Hydrolase, carbon-nitrogen family n=1 Tax=Deferribacter desulfuricans (strain DSM 14783 / JCM 11476 / NBRC 101012 / SSM1) TaxID=639282 RepID=D3PBI8_DEFDS|nr:nitrilase-related carbon-nitrogen hydrolase [Deferribacter desulfuricans]BAI79961.1 hydrolase, carbon-nitrogen family [Deferribacter desulfuricans SSM1]